MLNDLIHLFVTETKDAFCRFELWNLEAYVAKMDKRCRTKGQRYDLRKNWQTWRLEVMERWWG